MLRPASIDDLPPEVLQQILTATAIGLSAKLINISATTSQSNTESCRNLQSYLRLRAVCSR